MFSIDNVSRFFDLVVNAIRQHCILSTLIFVTTLRSVPTFPKHSAENTVVLQKMFWYGLVALMKKDTKNEAKRPPDLHFNKDSMLALALKSYMDRAMDDSRHA